MKKTKLKKKFNKKNLLKFAANLYEEKGNSISYMPLCDGTLAKANGEILHCALGELCEEFIGPVARRLNEKEISVLNEDCFLASKKFDLHEEDKKDNTKKFYSEPDICAILEENAVLRKIKKNEKATDINPILSDDYDDDEEEHYDLSTEILEQWLSEAIEIIPDKNDDGGNSEAAYIRRAKNLREYLERIANTCLGN